jgi:hypothetical protein
VYNESDILSESDINEALSDYHNNLQMFIR